MDSCFNFLDLKSNDELSNLNKKDLNEFIKQLLNYKLSLRNELGINPNYTFGLEIEFEHIKDIKEFEELFNGLKLKEGIVKSINNKLHLWNLKTDRSLNSTDGREITSPVLIDRQDYWNDLTKVCRFIKKKAVIGDKSAGHIHIGSQIIGEDKKTLLNIINLWAAYEDVIYRYSYNEYLNKLPGINYCHKARDMFIEKYYTFKDDEEISFSTLLSYLSVRIRAVNLSLVTNLTKNGFIANKDTIEFRCPNGTLDPVIWQNNVNTFIKLLLYCKGDKFDLDTISKRMHNLNYNYNSINLGSALELSDLIFDNNLDKLYFLRQYIKDNNVSEEAVRVRKFTC